MSSGGLGDMAFFFIGLIIFAILFLLASCIGIGIWIGYGIWG